MTSLTVVAALRTEYLALRGRVGAGQLVRCGMGPARARRWLDTGTPRPSKIVIVAGLAGALDPSLRAGDVVVASEVYDPLGAIVLSDAASLVAELRRAGLRAHAGAIVSTDHIVTARDEREQLAASGAVAVDMESAVLVRGLACDADARIAVVRVIVDTPESPVHSVATVLAGIAALRVLRQLGPTLSCWAEFLQAERNMERTAAPAPSTLTAPKGVA